MTLEEIAALDHELIERNVPLHARPFHVVLHLLKARGGGDIMAPELWEPVQAAFRKLYPTGDFSIPAMQIGGVGIRDRFYIARVNVGYGTFAIEPLKQIQIDEHELSTVWRLAPDQIWRALYAVTDLWDFAYGISDNRQQNEEADSLWNNSSSSIEATARLLASGTPFPDAAIQSACLAAELALKGTLAFLGVPEKRRFQLGHRLQGLAEEMGKLRPAASDSRLLAAVGLFPNYTQTRYSDHTLNRVQLMELAMRAQFVAAEAVRRVSDRNLAGTFEADPANTKRMLP